MSKNFPLITKIAISLVIAIVAIFVPNVPLRILLAVFSAILFILPLKKHGILFIITVCISALVGISVNAAMQYVDYFEFPVMARHPFGFMNYFFPLPGYKNNIGNADSGYNALYSFQPDKTVNGIDRISISGDFIRLEFDSGFDGVKYPSQANGNVKNETINIRAANSAKPYLITIGTAGGNKTIDVVSEKTDIAGSLKANSFSVNSEEIFFNGDFECEKEIQLYSNLTLSGSGSMKSPKIYLKADLTGINIEVERCGDIMVDSSVFSGSVRYTDEWEGTRKINFIAAGFGDIDVFIPSGSGNVDILHNSGLINSHKYTY